MSRPFHIRPAVREDVSALLPLVEQYWAFERVQGFDTSRVGNQLTRLLSTPALGRGWLATRGQATVGYLLAVLVFSLEHLGVTAEVDEFFVAPQHRGTGIGQALLSTAELALTGAGCTSISLQIGTDNDRARAFYFRNGYAQRRGFSLLDKSL